MKRYILALLLIPTIAIAADWKAFSALNTAAVTTTIGTVTQVTQLDEPFNYLSCDIISSSATSTGTFLMYYSANTPTPFATTATMWSSSTKTAGTILTVTATTTAKPFRNLDTRFTLATGAAISIGFNCVATK